MFGFGKRTDDPNQELPAIPPCAPSRGRITRWHYEEMANRWQGVSQALFASDAENKALRAELERLRAGGGRLDQATQVHVLVGQLEHINRLVATLERELDTERTEKAALEQQVEDMERDAYEYRAEIQRLRDRLAQAPVQPAQKAQPVGTWADDLERFEHLDVGGGRRG